MRSSGFLRRWLTGTDTIDELKLIRDETIQLLKLGTFELSKWALIALNYWK